MTAWGRAVTVKFMAIDGASGGKTVGTFRIPRRGAGFSEGERVFVSYRFMAMASPSMVSTVVTIFELAW